MQNKVLDISKINLFDETKKTENTIKTSIKVIDIEDKMSNILDKYSEFSRFYFNLTDYYWVISFKPEVCQGDFELMTKTMLEIMIYKDSNNNSIISISENIIKINEWSDLLKDLSRLKSI
jgi:hypothetical protein